MSIAVANMDAGKGAKTFSRARVVDTIRTQYRQMKIQQQVMDDCIDKLSRLEGQHEDYYNRTLIESMAQYRMTQTLIESWCDSFGISKGELDPSIAV